MVKESFERAGIDIIGKNKPPVVDPFEGVDKIKRESDGVQKRGPGVDVILGWLSEFHKQHTDVLEASNFEKVVQALREHDEELAEKLSKSHSEFLDALSDVMKRLERRCKR